MSDAESKDKVNLVLSNAYCQTDGPSFCRSICNSHVKETMDRE